MKDYEKKNSKITKIEQQLVVLCEMLEFNILYIQHFGLMSMSSQLAGCSLMDGDVQGLGEAIKRY